MKNKTKNKQSTARVIRVHQVNAYYNSLWTRTQNENVYLWFLWVEEALNATHNYYIVVNQQPKWMFGTATNSVNTVKSNIHKTSKLTQRYRDHALADKKNVHFVLTHLVCFWYTLNFLSFAQHESVLKRFCSPRAQTHRKKSSKQKSHYKQQKGNIQQSK